MSVPPPNHQERGAPSASLGASVCAARRSLSVRVFARDAGTQGKAAEMCRR